MPNPEIIRHELDWTGASVNNLVSNEEHTLLARRQRVVIPTYGAYFGKSMVITDLATGYVLKPGVDYTPYEFYQSASAQTMPTQEVWAMLVIINPSVSDRVSLKYQALGGHYGYSVQAIFQQIERLQLDNRPIKWPDILNRPLAYAPEPHLHDIGDVYGFEYIVHELQEIRAAMLLGDAASHDQIYAYIDKIEALLTVANGSLNSAFLAHKNDLSNPHQTTPAKIGAYAIAQVDALVQSVKDILNLHISNHANPHATDTVQIGTWTVAQIQAAIAAAAKTASDALNAFMARRDNPNVVTAAQTGAFTKAEVTALVKVTQDALNAFMARRDNPNVVTAAQTGLGNVPNWVPGTWNDLYYTNPGSFMSADVVRTYLDWRLSAYAVTNTGVNGSVHTPGNGYVYIWADGAWRRVWPADINNDNGSFNVQFDRRLAERFAFYA